jgi:hypothetical protein
LLYKLEINHANNADKDHHSNTTSIKDTATDIYLLVIWDFYDDLHDYCVCLCLIECADNFI